MKRTILLALTLIFALSALISLIGIYFAHQQPTEEEEAITLYTYSHYGKYDYIATLKPNDLYNKTILRPEEGILYIKITESINVTFTYTFNCSLPSNITLQYSTKEVLNSSKWPEKTMATSPLTVSTQDQTNATSFTTNHFINVTGLDMLKDSIDKETGTYTSEYSVSIQPKIEITANTTVGTISETFTPNMTISFRYGTQQGDYIAIDGLNQTKQGGIQHTETISHPEVMNQRYMSYTFSIASISALIGTAWAYVKTKPEKPAKPQKPIEETIAPYEEIIFEIEEEPRKTAETTTVKTKSLEDLISIADGLAKPILYLKKIPSRREEKTAHIFYVLDGPVRYEYEMAEPKTSENVGD